MPEYYFRTSSSESGVELYIKDHPEPIHFIPAEEFERIACENGMPSIDRIFESFLNSNGLEDEVNREIKDIKKKGGRLVMNRDEKMIEWPYKLVIG